MIHDAVITSPRQLPVDAFLGRGNHGETDRQGAGSSTCRWLSILARAALVSASYAVSDSLAWAAQPQTRNRLASCCQYKPPTTRPLLPIETLPILVQAEHGKKIAYASPPRTTYHASCHASLLGRLSSDERVQGIAMSSSPRRSSVCGQIWGR